MALAVLCCAHVQAQQPIGRLDAKSGQQFSVGQRPADSTNEPRRIEEYQPLAIERWTDASPDDAGQRKTSESGRKSFSEDDWQTPQITRLPPTNDWDVSNRREHFVVSASYETTVVPDTGAALDPIPLELPPPPPEEPEPAELIFDQVVSEAYFESVHCDPCDQCSVLTRLLSRFQGPRSPDGGVGRTRLGFAPLVIDPAQPGNSLSMRLESFYNLTFPDRAEMFWARPINVPGGKGPLGPEPSVAYQDIRFRLEVGGEKLSVTTDIPLRVLDPTFNGNTAGLSDLAVTTKVVLLDGRNWMLTQVFRVDTPTGAFRKGLGTGHVSLEPGLLARYRCNDEIYLHSELKYWFAVGGDPAHSGQAIRYGLGVSWIYSDFDTFAVIPSMELTGFSVLDGQKTLNAFGLPLAVDIDKEVVLQFHPSVRLVSDKGSDFGLFELALGASLDLGSDGWNDGGLRLEFRWSQ